MILVITGFAMFYVGFVVGLYCNAPDLTPRKKGGKDER